MVVDISDYPLERIDGPLVSQEYRALIEAGILKDVLPQTFSAEQKENLIQPASLDTATDAFCFRAEHDFKPEEGHSVYNSLRCGGERYVEELPFGEHGRSLEVNKSWVIPLKGQWQVPEGYRLIANPKSSSGRQGNLVCLLADGRSSLDYIEGPWKGKLYLLFRPNYWSNIMYENLSLNQVRIFYGYLNPVSAKELHDRWRELVQDLDGNSPVKSSVYSLDQGIEMTLDLVGERYSGIVGFSAKPNHDSFDQKGGPGWPDRWKEFFEVIEAPETRRLRLQDSNLKILNTQYRYPIPLDLCAEMAAFSLKTGDVRTHRAGFFDPFFVGTGTLEVENQGRSSFSLHHGDSVGKLVYFKNRLIPDKKYGGKEAASNYNGQVGPTLPKQFGKLTFERYRKIRMEQSKGEEQILVVSRSDMGLTHYQSTYFQGFSTEAGGNRVNIIKGKTLFLKRRDMESLPEFKQLIPYVVIVDTEKKSFFGYQRALNPQSLHENRLRGKWSIGVGGHVREEDGSGGIEAVTKGMFREVHDEVSVPQDISPSLIGYINDDRDSVGSVHFGLVYIAVAKESSVSPKSPELRDGGFFSSPQEFRVRAAEKEGIIEGWTEILLDALEKGILKL